MVRRENDGVRRVDGGVRRVDGGVRRSVSQGDRSKSVSRRVGENEQNRLDGLRQVLSTHGR